MAPLHEPVLVAETLALGLVAGLFKLLQALHHQQARGTYAHH